MKIKYELEEGAYPPLRAHADDAGSAESLLRSANTIMDIQKRTGRQVACLEEIAYKMGYIDREQLRAVGESMKKTTYGQYILGL